MRVGRANGEGWLRLSEAAAELGVSLNTLRRWSDSGKLTCYRSPGGHRRYRRADVETLLRAEDGGGPVREVAARRLTGDHDEARASLLTLARVAAEGVGVTECRISLAEGHGRFRILSARRTGREESSAEEETIGEALPTVREVLRTGRRVVIADLASTNLLERSEAEMLRLRGDAAVLAVPLAVDGRNRAVLELVESRAPRSFTGANVTFAEFMARQAARLLTDGLDDGLEQREVGLPEETVPGETRLAQRPEDLLATLADRMRHELGAAACDILRYDRDADALEPVAASATGESPPLRGLLYPAADFGEVAAALVSGEPVAITDLTGLDVAGPHLVRREQSGARSVYAAPIHLGRAVAGLVEVYGGETGWMPDKDERALVDAAAATAALALSGDHDAAVLTRRIAYLDDLIAGFSTNSPAMDAESLVLSTLQALRTRPDFDACTVYRVDGSVARPFPAGDVGGNPVAGGQAWTLSDFPAAAKAVTGRAPVVVTADAGSPQLHPETLTPALAARGLAGVVLTPVVFWDRLVGVLEFGSATPQGLATAEHVAQVAADLLAVALGSGDVIARLQRRNRDLALVVEAGLEDTARLSTDEVLHAVVERLSDLTSTPVADIYAVEGDTLRALVSYDGGRFDTEWDGVVLPLAPLPLQPAGSGDG